MICQGDISYSRSYTWQSFVLGISHTPLASSKLVSPDTAPLIKISIDPKYLAHNAATTLNHENLHSPTHPRAPRLPHHHISNRSHQMAERRQMRPTLRPHQLHNRHVLQTQPRSHGNAKQHVCAVRVGKTRHRHDRCEREQIRGEDRGQLPACTICPIRLVQIAVPGDVRKHKE
jgi:hypothetical protein